MAVLIIGLGYLGAALASQLVAAGQRVVGLDNGFATNWPVLEALAASAPDRFSLRHGDIREPADVAGAFAAADPVEVVYLLAAQASAHPDAAPATYTEDTNLRGPRLVCDAALNHGRPPVVYGSSFHVYGPGLVGEVTETTPYGALRDLAHLSKVYVEKLGEMYALTRDLDFAPVRLGIVYGPGPVMKRDLRFVTVPHAFCLRVLAGQTLPIHPSGLIPLAFVHVDDAVAALCLAAVAGGPGVHIGYAPANATSELASALDVARLVQRAAWDAGRDAVLQLHAPQGAVEASASAAVEPTFAVRSRLTDVGWHPGRRLAATIPTLMAFFSAGMPDAVVSGGAA